MALQTPKQRAANAKFEKKVTKQWGKPKSDKDKVEYPVSKMWLFVLLFLVAGGAILELIPSINDELNPYAAQSSNVIVLPYDSTTQPSKTILVRLNNYNNTLFDGGDLLNVKLCWPATLPFDFRISHEYIKTKELIEESLDPAQLDLYLRIDYQFFGVTYDEKFLKSQGEVKFQLFVNKLPFKLIPIPLELYDFVVYLADLLILLLTQIKFLKRIFI
ncbi:hypothetical protein I9W82_000495 [Candida metapsilosis]|uniref:Stress-associated endoplasmic reticulum protein n=1 Tax=Candida metapsilosis TaxID=273372 RepID=A0A8H7ZGI8_9ASCO|nr:hypothetical protein I9W82_000495 [Candida metapsilosis]